MQIVELRVHMDCPGCERKITRALSKLDGVDNVDINMAMQKVTVTGWADQRKVLKTVRKTGRQAELWPFPYNPEYHDYHAHYYYGYRNGNGNGNGSPTNHMNYYTIGYSSSANHFVAKPTPPSTYNYRVHGYNGHDHGYYQQPPYSVILDEKTTSVFSDDNPTGCSIM